MSNDDMSDRRNFLKAAASASFAGAVACQAAAATAQEVLGAPLSLASQEIVEYEAYRSLEGKRFRVFDPETGFSTRLVLEEVTLHPLHPDDARPAHCRQVPFSLLFSGNSSLQLEDKSYLVTNRKLGQEIQTLLTVGFGGIQNRSYYQVIFN